MELNLDEFGDHVTDRGFRHTMPVLGVEGYGGQIRVYESSGAAAPRVWIAVEPQPDEEPDREGHLPDGVIHLEVRDALAFAENIIRTCRLHYQLEYQEDQ